MYWGSPLIAQTILGFGFADGGQVCISIETRKEIGEEYSAVKGFFRQDEKTYIMADERDVVGLRTNFRHEDVYLYRLRVTPKWSGGSFSTTLPRSIDSDGEISSPTQSMLHRYKAVTKKYTVLCS